MRKPNGYGTIKKLSGNRRRPFVFLISDHGRQKPIEYFPTQIEAEIFAADYNKIHRNTSLAGHQMTFEELYHRWLSRHIADTSPSASAISGYKNSYQHCSSIHGMPFTDIKYNDYQLIIDGMKKIWPFLFLIKKGQIFDFSYVCLCSKNRSWKQRLCPAPLSWS